jgi:nucleotide-binding universal stress UspA family protein
MGMYGRILAATDGSPSGDTAVKHAIGLAAQNDCPLDIIYVKPKLYDSLDFYQSEELEKALDKEAGVFLSSALKEAGERGVKAEDHVLSGEPEEEIVRFAESSKADLIVMGSHGHKGLAKLLIGSVAERVIGRAHCPVLVMKHR